MRFVASLTLLLFVFGVGLVGCVPTLTKSEITQDETISARALQRWQHLIKGEFDVAYGYLSPSYRSGVTLSQYRSALKAGLWKSAKVVTIRCSGLDVCQVAIDVGISYYHRTSGEVTSTQRFSENWRRDGEGWWYVPDLG
jgi:hypothetical protein